MRVYRNNPLFTVRNNRIIERREYVNISFNVDSVSGYMVGTPSNYCYKLTYSDTVRHFRGFINIKKWEI